MSSAQQDQPTISIITQQPEFIRLPRPGESDPMTGMSRSTLLELIFGDKRRGVKAVVESIHVRKPGNQRGIRLIKYASLSRYINSQHANGKAKTPKRPIRPPKANKRGFKYSERGAQ